MPVPPAVGGREELQATMGPVALRLGEQPPVGRRAELTEVTISGLRVVATAPLAAGACIAECAGARPLARFPL